MFLLQSDELAVYVQARAAESPGFHLVLVDEALYGALNPWRAGNSHLPQENKRPSCCSELWIVAAVVGKPISSAP